MAMRGNFHELMSLLFSQEALFDSLMTKLFYSMRAHGIIADFDFFFTEVNDKWLCDVFCNLCGKRFYFDELREVYLKGRQAQMLCNCLILSTV